MLNENFLRLPENYLFSDIARRVHDFQAAHPEARIIRLGIGDVTQPLAPAVIEAMHKAVDEMSRAETFHGYGPEQGYEFLRRAIAENDLWPRGVLCDLDEIFISDGAKSDCGNIGDIFSTDCPIVLTDPVYPVYIDSNVMSGRAGVQRPDGSWERVTFLPVTAENGFVPQLPKSTSVNSSPCQPERALPLTGGDGGGLEASLIYLCYPNNPTGTVISRTELQRWVDYALQHNCVILYDAAYEAYIRHEDIPHSIYEIEGARRCAIEFHSFSKTAGFTGVRCGYTIVPKELTANTSEGREVSLNALWNRRQCTKFNGTSYITQRAAEAIYSPEGRAQVKATIDYYMDNAQYLRRGLERLGYTVFGGEDAPYVWLKTPDGSGSWEFFDRLLHELHIVTTPGVGFGPSGEGYIRLTAFGKKEDYEEAIKRFEQWNL